MHGNSSPNTPASSGAGVSLYQAGAVNYHGISPTVTLGKWCVGRAIAFRDSGDRQGMRLMAKEFAYVSMRSHRIAYKQAAKLSK